MEKYGKIDEANQIKSELAIVDGYLPKKASPEETAALVEAFLAKNTFTEKQIGQAMGMFMKEQGTNVDPGVVNPLIKKGLAGKMMKECAGS